MDNIIDILLLAITWLITLKCAYDYGYSSSAHDEAIKRIDSI